MKNAQLLGPSAWASYSTASPPAGDALGASQPKNLGEWNILPYVPTHISADGALYSRVPSVVATALLQGVRIEPAPPRVLHSYAPRKRS